VYEPEFLTREDERELLERCAAMRFSSVRREYVHRIPPVDALRYSITFRTLRGAP
jgi:hypothetical protein